MGFLDLFRAHKTSPRNQIPSNNGQKDERKAQCPYCDRILLKVPGSKTKCPNCGQYMFVRTRPKDNARVVVTKEEADQIEEDWSIVAGTHDFFLEQKKETAEMRETLRKRFGKEPSVHDVAWGLLNKELIEHMSRGDWGLYRNARFQMGEILRKEMKFKGALEFYLEVCCLDINGASNTGGIKEFTAFDPEHSFIAPGVVDLIQRISKKLGITLDDLKEMFISHNTRVLGAMRLPKTPEECWSELEHEIKRGPE